MSTGTQLQASMPTTSIDLSLLTACAHGRCDESGNVFIKTSDGETLVGQWQLDEGSGDPIAFFARRYLDLVTEVELTRTRLKEHNITPSNAESVLQKAKKSCGSPNFVGDLAALQARLDQLESEISTASMEFQAKKAAQKDEVLRQRESLALRAEKSAASRKWRETQAEFVAIVEEWKALPRVNKGTESKLWKRISTARSTFEKNRRTHFADRKMQAAESQQAKKELIKQAEQLATSTDWEKSSKALGSLMQKWKAAPRADRKTEEKLWRDFSAARDTFFGAKKAAEAKAEEAARANVPAAKELVEKIERVRQVSDLRIARETLRPLLDAYDRVGPLPKPEEKALSRQIKQVQDEIKAKEDAARKRNDPEKSSRANNTAHQLKQRMDSVRQDLKEAEERGDQVGTAKLRTQLESQQALLDAAEAVLKEFAN